MARFLDPELQALLEAERRGARKAREPRPLRTPKQDAGQRSTEGTQGLGRRTFGSGNRFPAPCARQGCPDRAQIPTGQGLLTKSETGAWEVLHASCN